MSRLNGDFAIAPDDRRDGTLWLARDRFGVRPAVLPARSRCIASRPAAQLLRLAGCRPRPRPRSFVACSRPRTTARSTTTPTPRPTRTSPSFRPPTCCVGPRRRRCARRAWYWTLEEAPDLDATRGRAGRALPRAAAGRRASCGWARVGPRRFHSLRRHGLLVGAGLRRAADRASASTRSPRSTAAASTTSPTRSESMLESSVEQWHRVVVDAPDVPALVAQMIEAHDEPVATATWLSHYVLCRRGGGRGLRHAVRRSRRRRAERRRVRVLLFRFADLRAAGDEEALRHEVDEWRRHHDHPVFRKNREVMEAGLEAVRRPSNARGDAGPTAARIERYDARRSTPASSTCAAWSP